MAERHLMGRLAFVTMLVASVVLAAGSASAAQLTLTWVDNSSGSATFKIERKTGTSGTYALIATTEAGINTFTDSTVASGTTYCYRVRASSPYGSSAYSNEACGSAPTGLAVTVVKAGTGSGTVVSDPAGINCGSDCAEVYAAGRVVALTAVPASGSTFSGWTEGCTGTDPCVVTGNTPLRVTATFASATASGVSLTASPATVAAGSPVTATWSGIAGPSSTDWVGLYAPGTAATAFIQWAYVSCTKTPGAARAAGSCPLTVPAGLASGMYELRLYAKDGFGLLATSQRFSVTR